MSIQHTTTTRPKTYRIKRTYLAITDSDNYEIWDADGRLCLVFIDDEAAAISWVKEKNSAAEAHSRRTK